MCAINEIFLTDKGIFDASWFVDRVHSENNSH